MKIPAAMALILAAMLLLSACRVEFSTTNLSAPAPAAAPVVSTISPVDPGWKSPDPEVNAPVLPNIADVVERGYPGVVTITTEQVVNDMFSGAVLQSGAGSGWILDGSGIIVTNNHVVEGARKVVVQFSDGRTSEVTADNVYRDPLTDLAIIKVNLNALPTVAIGDSGKLRVGDWVVAIGNPLGKGIKAKEGIVSGIKVSLSLDEDESLYDLIETSAAINQGNSGGPLLNMKGEVIGITSAKIASIGVEGMGYAISINSALPILKELVNKGYITRPFLGVELYTVNDYVAYYNGLSVKRGAIVTTVQPGSPAARAGLRRLDVIIRYQGKEITTAPDLLRELRSSKIGDEITVTYVRGKISNTVKALLTDSPPPR
jgi:serine protease Do